MGVSMEKVELVFQVNINTFTKLSSCEMLCIFTGSSPTTIRGSCCYENVRTGKNQCQFTDLLDQQEILWHIGALSMQFVTVPRNGLRELIYTFVFEM